MRGSSLETGVANTVCCEREVVFDDVSDVLSMWHTYLERNGELCAVRRKAGYIRLPVPLDNTNNATSRLPFLCDASCGVSSKSSLLRSCLLIIGAFFISVVCVVILERS